MPYCIPSRVSEWAPFVPQFNIWMLFPYYIVLYTSSDRSSLRSVKFSCYNTIYCSRRWLLNMGYALFHPELCLRMFPFRTLIQTTQCCPLILKFCMPLLISPNYWQCKLHANILSTIPSCTPTHLPFLVICPADNWNESTLPLNSNVSTLSTNLKVLCPPINKSLLLWVKIAYQNT